MIINDYYWVNQMKLKLTTIILMAGLGAYAQGGISTFKGKVVNALTHKPIASAYIAMPSIGYSTATNDEGAFVFNFPTISLDSQVVVSVMGFDNFSQKASEFYGGIENTIEIQPAPPSLAILGIAEARTFVQAAVDSIKANFLMEAAYQNGFYCEMVNYEKIGLVKINEGIIRVERFPGTPEREDKIKYLKGRRLEWQGQTSKMDGFGFENGASIVTRSIETSLPIYLSEKEIKHYEFRMDSTITMFDGMPIYSVSFKPLNRRVEYPRTGKIYIEPESKAIVRIEYEMTPTAAHQMMNTGFSNIKVVGKNIKAYSQFRKLGGKWVLQDSSIDFQASFEEKIDNKFAVEATIVLRFVPTISLPLVRSSIPQDRQLLSTDKFPKSRSLNEELWQENNFLLPTTDMRKIEAKAN